MIALRLAAPQCTHICIHMTAYRTQKEKRRISASLKDIALSSGSLKIPNAVINTVFDYYEHLSLKRRVPDELYGAIEDFLKKNEQYFKHA